MMVCFHGELLYKREKEYGLETWAVFVDKMDVMKRRKAYCLKIIKDTLRITPPASRNLPACKPSSRSGNRNRWIGTQKKCKIARARGSGPIDAER